ncbi:Peptidase family M23 [Candidatus Burarchaeum australiense]|nr:Peptidase family M23 [Candidatus Burarchaeum australiense]
MVCNYEDPPSAMNWYYALWNFITGHAPETKLVGGHCGLVPCLTENLAAELSTKTGTLVECGKNKPIKCAEDLAVAPDQSINYFSGSDDFMKSFMLGQGPTFSDFDTANSFCGYSMGFAVRWYSPTQTLPFTPSKDRASCYLKSNVLPVYVFRPDKALEGEPCSHGANLKLCYLENLSKEMNGVGPVIIAPEAEFTASQAGDIATQIELIHDNCDKCLVAVIPDQTVVPDEFDINGAPVPPDSALRELATAHPAEFQHVDFIGLHFLLNEYSPTCTASEAVYRLVNYSKETLAHYGKPSMLLYYGAANDNTICTSDQVSAANDYLITSIPAMASSGIVGLAQYQFKDGGINPAFANAVPCPPDKPYCNLFGLVDVSSTQKQPQFSTWFSKCQFYYNATPDTVTGYRGIYSQPPVTFPPNGENTSMCTFQTYIDLYKLAISSTQSISPSVSDIDQLPVIGCDNCLGIPNPRFYSGATAAILDRDLCEEYGLEMRRESEKCDLDPLLVKAIVWAESSFNPGAVSQVAGYNGDCWSSTPPKDPVPPSEPNSFRPDTLWFPETSQCACGLMQTINPWHDSYFGDVCPNFNPFVPESSICGGTFKFCDYRQQFATPFVNKHAGDFGVNPNVQDADYRWAVMWATLIAYNAGPGNLNHYYNNWKSEAGCHRDEDGFPEDPKACCSSDFIEYVNECPAKNGNPYAANVIAKYMRILKTCPNDCEGGVNSYGSDLNEAGDNTQYSPSCDLLNNPYTYTPVPANGLLLPVNDPSLHCCGQYCTYRAWPWVHYHAGIDLCVPMETVVHAANSGKVHRSHSTNGGNILWITDPITGIRTKYMHLHCNGYLVDEGDTVNAGDPIALSGGGSPDSAYCRGDSSTPHVHFEVLDATGLPYNVQGGKNMDPAYFVDTCPSIPPSGYP